jgi:DNA topoisomerase IA
MVRLVNKEFDDLDAQIAQLRAELADARRVIDWYADADNYCTDISQSQISTAYQLGRVQSPAIAWREKYPEVKK